MWLTTPTRQHDGTHHRRGRVPPPLFPPAGALITARNTCGRGCPVPTLSARPVRSTPYYDSVIAPAAERLARLARKVPTEGIGVTCGDLSTPLPTRGLFFFCCTALTCVGSGVCRTEPQPTRGRGRRTQPQPGGRGGGAARSSVPPWPTRCLSPPAEPPPRSGQLGSTRRAPPPSAAILATAPRAGAVAPAGRQRH